MPNLGWKNEGEGKENGHNYFMSCEITLLITFKNELSRLSATSHAEGCRQHPLHMSQCFGCCTLLRYFRYNLYLSTGGIPCRTYMLNYGTAVADLLELPLQALTHTPIGSLTRSLTHPSPPKVCLIAESTRLPIGLIETEHNASTAPTAKTPPATSTDGRKTAYKLITP